MKNIVYETNKNLIRDYLEETKMITDGIIMPGQSEFACKLASLSRNEVNLFLMELDALASQSINNDMQYAIANTASLILDIFRVVKLGSKHEYKGQCGIDHDQIMTWLAPWHIGSEYITNALKEVNKGLYGNINCSNISWLHHFTLGSHTIFPLQCMNKFSAIIHIGISDSEQTPKVSSIRHQISRIIMPIQTIDLYISCIKSNRDITNKDNVHLSKYIKFPSFVAFSKPIVILPERLSQVDLYANIGGHSSPKLVSILITSAQALNLQ